MPGDILKVRIPPPLLQPAPGAGGADRATWFSHLLWPPLLPYGPIPGLFELAQPGQEAGQLRLCRRDGGPIPTDLVDAVARVLRGHRLTRSPDGRTLTVQIPQGWPPEWTVAATVPWRPEGGAYRLAAFDPAHGLHLRRSPGVGDGALPEKIEVHVVDDADESMDCLELGLLDVAVELSHPRLAGHPTLSCWAAGARDGFAVQALSWHRGPTDRAHAVIARLLDIPDLAERCAAHYGQDAVPATRPVVPAAVAPGGMPVPEGPVRVLINRENPTRAALLRMLDQLAAPSGVRFDAVPVDWTAMSSETARAVTDASLTTTWCPHYQAAETGRSQGSGHLPALPLTLHPQMSVAAWDPAVVGLLAQQPVPLRQWQHDAQLMARRSGAGRLAPGRSSQC